MIRKFIIICSLLAITGCAALLKPNVETEFSQLKAGEYRLDKTHATVLFKVQHLGLSTYVGRFNEIDASLEFDPKNLDKTRLQAIIEMRSLDINNPDLNKDLQGRQWFSTAEFPQAKFSTQSVVAIGEKKFEFVGELDWRGVQKPITMIVDFHGGANNILTGKYTLGFSATGQFKRSDFGMDAYLALVSDEIQIEAYAEFQRN
jgi:polyisoprenoid-binding protein YceI